MSQSIDPDKAWRDQLKVGDPVLIGKPRGDRVMHGKVVSMTATLIRTCLDINELNVMEFRREDGVQRCTGYDRYRVMEPTEARTKAHEELVEKARLVHQLGGTPWSSLNLPELRTKYPKDHRRCPTCKGVGFIDHGKGDRDPCLVCNENGYVRIKRRSKAVAP